METEQVPTRISVWRVLVLICIPLFLIGVVVLFGSVLSGGPWWRQFGSLPSVDRDPRPLSIERCEELAEKLSTVVPSLQVVEPVENQFVDRDRLECLMGVKETTINVKVRRFAPTGYWTAEEVARQEFAVRCTNEDRPFDPDGTAGRTLLAVSDVTCGTVFYPDQGPHLIEVKALSIADIVEVAYSPMKDSRAKALRVGAALTKVVLESV